MSEPEFIELDESDINTIDVYVEPLELYKLLKIANLVGGGGEAKMLIADGHVGVNGELCQQKRKKIYQGDLVEFNGEFMQIRLVDAPQKPAFNATDASDIETEELALTKQAKPESRKSSPTNKRKAKAGKSVNSGKAKKAGKPDSNKKSDSETNGRGSGRRSISF
ncbi:RNA-binding S4 domain-containing protein [Thalassotalea litorea]|uniref:RNA-binding S4 domain-containing protein n=1 Tax=Thalassotalea litorea TaxID=2020715 RepID=UPI001FEB33CD|nr:RNA-binding S4 domain-containing protein [Thalassotalea litorea]